MADGLPMGAIPTGTWAGPPQGGGGTPDDFGKQFWQADPSMMEPPQPFQVPPMHPGSGFIQSYKNDQDE